MRSTALLAAAATFIAAVGALFATPAAAQSARTFVSGTGTDTGTCAVIAPCRSFAYAITQTNAGGEIAVLSSAGYGAVTINKAISITNEEGVEAAITVPSGDGITVSAPNAATVTLSGLTLIGSGGNNGITVTDVGTLDIKNCVIVNFESRGINFTAGGGGATFVLHVADTQILGSLGAAMFMSPTGAAVYDIAIERTQATSNNGGGFVVFGGGTSVIHVTASDSTADANGSSTGFSLANASGTTGSSTFTVVNSRSLNNGVGVSSNSTAGVMYLSGVTVSGNTTGYSATSGGVIDSYGNNAITDSSNSGNLSSVALH